MDPCRVCENEGFYNIFTDDLSIENNKIMKIYIVLNNFLFEKLYAADEHSSSVCQSCFENLHNSYHFMLKVRDSEKKRDENQAPVKKRKKDYDVEQAKVNQVQDSISIEELSCGNVSDEEDIEEYVQEDEPLTIVEDVVDEKKLTQDYVTFNQNTLECRVENNQTYVGVKIEKINVKKSECEYYVFNLPYHKDAAAIYSCLYCVKAFGNLELLMKHFCSCHLCTFCLETFSTYNGITKHVKEVHQKNNLNCPFCLKAFNSSTFRSHVKKQHVKKLPQFVYLLAQ